MTSDIPDTDPYAVLSDSDRAFWADAVADAIEDRDPQEPLVIKGGVSPSGIPHIGHVNEILRAYYVAAVLRERGYEVRQVFTSDDRDRLRKLPRQLADLDGNIVSLGEVDAGALGRNLGRPYTEIPDPFGVSDSYGDHFTKLLKQSVQELDIDVEFVSNTSLYKEGVFDEVVQHVLKNQETAREVLTAYQDKVDEDYVPFFAICEECGQLTETITDVNIEAGEISYTCTDIETGDDTIAGCGHEGTTSVRDGKLPWRFEWPAQWKELDVDFEPFGKDHAEGSWPSGVDVAQNVVDIEPPVPMVYEWFTLEGKALSSSSGHVVRVDEVLDLLEPEVLRYFFVKEPLKQRDFSIQRIDQLVDEFDRFEATYFGERDATESERAFADRAYPLVVDEVREERVRIPYTFAAVLGMTEDEQLREDIARKQGHITEDTPEWAVEEALARVERARNWARETGNEFDYKLKRQEMPDVSFGEAMETALDELAEFVAAGHDGEAIQSEIYETAKRHDIDMSEFFSAGYRLFFDDDEGPQLGTFLGNLDREFVVGRLRREK